MSASPPVIHAVLDPLGVCRLARRFWVAFFGFGGGGLAVRRRRRFEVLGITTVRFV